MDRLNTMSIFNTVVEQGSFSAAARKLCKPQTTISRLVKELEEYLGAQLLVRSTRCLKLTEVGQRYLESSRRILEQVGEMERIAAGEYRTPQGNLTVTAPVVFGHNYVLPLAMEFLKQYPDVGLRLILEDQNMHLYEDLVDVAVRIGNLPDSGIIAKRVGEVSKIVCASPSYLSKHSTPLKPEELKFHQCITFEGLDAITNWEFYHKNTPYSVNVTSRIRVNTIEAAVNSAKAGLGITRILSYQAAPWVKDNSLSILLRNFSPPSYPVNLLYIRQAAVPLKVRLFLDFIAPRLKTMLLKLK